MDSDVAVVICAYTEDRWQDLVVAVESVQRQTVLPRAIILVVDHNPALLKRALASLAGVVVTENRGLPGASEARNSGVAMADAETKIIAFLDDDAIAHPDWIEHHRAGYSDAHVLGIGGKTEPLW